MWGVDVYMHLRVPYQRPLGMPETNTFAAYGPMLQQAPKLLNYWPRNF